MTRPRVSATVGPLMASNLGDKFSTFHEIVRAARNDLAPGPWDYLIGGVTVFALPAGLPIYVDDTLMDLPWLILGGGSRASKIRTSPEALRRLPGARVVAGLTTGAGG